MVFPLASLFLYSRKFYIRRGCTNIDYCYAAILIVTYIKHHRDLNKVLASNTTLKRNGFIQLLSLGLFDILVTLPLAIIGLVQDVLQHEVSDFYPGMEAVHSGFSTVPIVPADEWKSAGFWTIFGVKSDEWINLILAFGFFLLFGLTERKRAWYRNLLWGVMKPLGYKPHTDIVVATTILFGSASPANSLANDTHITR